MSGKKRKQTKRNPHRAGGAGGQSLDSRDSKSKRLHPATRNLLFLNLVALSGTQLLLNRGMIQEAAAGVITLVCLFLLLYALWLQLRYSRREL